ncbi:MAG: hypothetical protein IJZ88_04115 [Clostridia bacterium]|nr:hypothetical protein [Clostridia bacterium]
MPNIATKVSVEITPEKELILKEKLGQAISLLKGKSEAWLMLSFEDNCRIWFKGDNSRPSAFVEVQVLGKINPAESEQLSAEICSIFESELAIPQDRTYIKYEEIDQWGWNGGNF